MPAQHKLKQVESPERAELRRLIGEHAEFQSRRGKLLANEQAFLEALSEAVEAIAQAETDVEDARGAAGRYIVAASSGQAMAPPPSVREARNRLQDAQDRRDAAADALKQVQAELAGLVVTTDLWPKRLQEAASHVLRTAPAIAGIIERVTRAQRELLDHALQLRFLIRTGTIPTDDIPAPQRYGAPTPSPARQADMLIEIAPLGWHLVEQTVAGARPWEQALRALMDDPDAPLPG